ncbi:MAG: glycosyltransferase [Chloroflexi bacterium]|nr:glycosyltransferase [Chloroflexota bacterium]
MRICMVVYSLEEFGGLEEIVATLTIGLQQQGHQTSVLSTSWVAPGNQYARQLHEHQIPLVQLPKWLSYPLSHWPTKEKILVHIMRFMSPLVYLLAGLLFLRKRAAWSQALASAHGWLRGQVMSRLIGPDRRRPLVRLLLRWWQFRWRPDVLHIQNFQSDTNSLLFVIDWADAHKMPVVYEEHQTPDPQFDWWQGVQTTLNKASIVVAVSEKSAQALRTVCGVTQPIVVANPIVTDPRRLQPAAPAQQGQVTESSGDQPLCVTTVARLYVMKGLPYLLEAIAQIKQTHPTVQFKVYGDGPLHQALLAQASQLGLAGEAIFVGMFRRQELPAIMAQTDIFVLPSILEGLPLSVIEAMAYGCPIVATAVGGIPELIEDGVNGLLCQPADSAGLAQQIQTLIEDARLRDRLGSAARHAYEHGPFQSTAVCDHFNLIYQQVVSRQQTKAEMLATNEFAA